MSRACSALLFAAALGCSPGAGAPPAHQDGAARSAPVGATSAAPDFTLHSLDGKSVTLSHYLGRNVVLIDFWATYCDPCLTAMPHLDELYQKYRAQGFLVLGVSIDGPDSVALVRNQVQKLGVSFPILLDQETRVVALYNPKTSAPYSVLIGKDGRVLTKQEGYVTGDSKLVEQDIQRALQIPGAQGAVQAPTHGASYADQKRAVTSSRVPSKGG